MILLISLVLSNEAHAIDYQHTASIVPVNQAQSNWCWAACAQMISSHFYPNSTINQNQIVTYVKGGLVNQTAQPQELINAIKYATYNTQTYVYTYAPIGFSGIDNNIYNGYPVVANVYSHAVLVYQTLSISNQFYYVTYYDPDWGQSITLPYADFLSGTFNPPYYAPYLQTCHKL